jgi:uncharacterized protein YbaR (Trm112 family)
MFIEMLDLLRCINDHEDTWLVASFRTVSNRFVQDATLGCPVCAAKYPIEKGIVDFTRGEVVPSCEEERAHASHQREELATRAGAYLNATEPGATFALGGVWAYAAGDLSRIADVRVLALNPTNAIQESERVGLLRVATSIPVAPASLMGIALDAWFPKKIVDSAVRSVRAGGRIVGPTDITPPAGVQVLARDESYWVAQKPPEVITLRRASQ